MWDAGDWWGFVVRVWIVGEIAGPGLRPAPGLPALLFYMDDHLGGAAAWKNEPGPGMRERGNPKTENPGDPSPYPPYIYGCCGIFQGFDLDFHTTLNNFQIFTQAKGVRGIWLRLAGLRLIMRNVLIKIFRSVLARLFPNLYKRAMLIESGFLWVGLFMWKNPIKIFGRFSGRKNSIPDQCVNGVEGISDCHSYNNSGFYIWNCCFGNF